MVYILPKPSQARKKPPWSIVWFDPVIMIYGLLSELTYMIMIYGPLSSLVYIMMIHGLLSGLIYITMIDGL